MLLKNAKSLQDVLMHIIIHGHLDSNYLASSVVIRAYTFAVLTFIGDQYYVGSEDCKPTL